MKCEEFIEKKYVSDGFIFFDKTVIADGLSN